MLKEFEGILEEPQVDQENEAEQDQQEDNSQKTYQFFFDKKLIKYTFNNDEIDQYLVPFKQEIKDRAMAIR